MNRSLRRYRGAWHGLLATALLLAGAGPVGAATITWGLPTDIASDTDVSLDGSLIRAFNFGDDLVSSTTINGVLFDPFPISGLSSTYTVGSTYTFANLDTLEVVVPAATSSWQGVSSEYLSLLTSAVELNPDRVNTLTLAGLTIGQNYLLQLWVNNSDRAILSACCLFETWVSDGLNDVNLYAGDNGTGLAAPQAARPGQYVLGTFTADAMSQDVYLANGEIPGWVNGFQLRSLPATAPEPGTLTLLLAGAVAGLVARRRARSRG